MKQTKRVPVKATGIALCALVLCLGSGCGLLETSKYEAGSADSGDMGRTEDASPRPPTSKTPVPNAVKRVDPPPPPGVSEVTFDTGVPKCVRDAFASTSTPLFVPPKRTQTLASFSNLTSLRVKEDLWVLFDLLLREVVTPSEGWVAYTRLRSGGDLEGTWSLFRRGLASADLPVGLDENAKITFWLNTYNALMIDILVRAPNALDAPNRSATFRTANLEVAGQTLSLDAIEYGVLGLNGRRITPNLPPESLPSSVETRLHFGLVCGARSCPRLRNFAYVPSQLGTALNENAHMFFNDGEKHVVVNAGDGSVKVSALFGWFPIDFDVMGGGMGPGDAARFLLRECRSDVDAISSFFSSLPSFSKLTPAQKLTYDWAPNSQ